MPVHGEPFRCAVCDRVLAVNEHGVWVHRAGGYACQPVGPMVCRCGVVTVLPDLSGSMVGVLR